MPSSTPAALRKQLAARRPDAVYLIVGDDELERAALVAAFEALVEPDLAAFNMGRFDGADGSRDPASLASAVVQAARTLPMLADRRVVLLVRAERLFKGRRGRQDAGEAPDPQDAPAGGLDVLVEYVTAPVPETTLVVAAADMSKATRLGKALYRHATVVGCWGLKEDKEVRSWELPQLARRAEAWVAQQAAAAGVAIDREAARLLAVRAGADMTRLRADLERTLIFASGKARVTRDDVAEVVGPETSQDAFAVTSAIAESDAPGALRQLALALEAGAVPYMVLGQLGWFVRDRLPRLAPARVPAAVEALFRADLALKSSGGEPRVLLERLVVELCGGAGARRSPRRALHDG